MVKIGMVGVGAISGIYLKNITGLFQEIEVEAVCDLVREKAEKAKEEYGVPKIYDTMYDLFADDEIDIVLNLTRPYEHYEVTKAALEAGKHVYSEKPLAATFEEGKALVELAKDKGLMLGGAPDTFMGAGIQTCRKLIEDGFIGTPVGAAAFMICRGHESWHPDPEFYYKHGGGPMMDMGPYYLTAMINLLGGVRGVTGVAKTSFPQRVITSQPKAGTVIDVDVPTYVTGILDFDSGAVGTLFTTFDVVNNGQARFEVYGSEGTLLVPDPNTFGGPVLLLRQEEKEFKEIPLMFDYADNSRGLGLADMAKSLETGRAFRAGYEQTLHVLEVMTAFERSSMARAYVEIESDYQSAPAMKHNPLKGVLD
ncbi:Gfo/Idh/MocA family protein [Lachnotalea sp. AF33-28]|uniref:Gfo/Idh/MocA family protein n=1 Tax=Lachnotalea sp. AF33-28 TaxID=2292046 RepID=UPI000E51DF08|nr:Gfo/Idh/MocA family oxidoreductase [Lachnotalea sp. AF33-28]RHP32080.1 gfo/Idh/MocA family oxidoreductase [Lachnotalea sp. AF33-28]